MEKKYFEKAIEIFHRRIALKNSSAEDKDTDIYDSNIYNNLGFANEMFKNYTEAHKYYLLASDEGCSNSFANLNLGYLYDNGLGVEKDVNKALVYYEKGHDRLEEWNAVREKFKNN